MKITVTISDDDGSNEVHYTSTLDESFMHLVPRAFDHALYETWLEMERELKAVLGKRNSK